MGGGGGGGWNPFQDVSWSRPFGNSELGNALQGNPNAPLTPDGKVKETGEQLVMDQDQVEGGGSGYQTGAGHGMPVQDPSIQRAAEFQAQLDAETQADNAAKRKARQDEADIFTNRYTGSQGKQQVMQSLQGLQDQARRLKGRKLFEG